MKTKKISDRELQRRARHRGMSIDDFGDSYEPGRTKTFEEIKTGRLRAKKIGRRTIITEDDAEAWLQQLPSVAIQTAPPKKAST